MKNYLLYYIFLVLPSFSVRAQTINLEFPYFAGKTYDFIIFQGDKRLILKSDTIAKGGKIQLTIPEQYKGYKGMARWYLTNSATGGGLDLIINNEDFSVACLDSIPTAENIVYKNTSENMIDHANYKKQEQLYEKHDAMLATKRAYDEESKLYKLASIEYNSLIKQFEDYNKTLSISKLYAAKFRQIVNLTMGIGTTITLDEKEKAKDINHFITNELDFEVLYTSNHWTGIINNWVQMQTTVFKDDAKLIDDATSIINRIKSDLIYTDFATSLTKELTKVGKDDAVFALIPVIKKSKRLLNYDGVLNIFKQDLTGKAPDLVFYNSVSNKENKNQEPKIIKTAELNSNYSLLLFYKSGCGPCQATIEGLQKNYEAIASKGVRIIALSSDVDENEFKKTAATFPWSDTYCDFKGMKSLNFNNYAVIATPTLFLLDTHGLIIQKMSGFAEVLEFFKPL